MHFVQAKQILSAHNGMNLYRGCQHGCIYCDSRSHCYHMNHAFEDIEVKENAILLLEQALRKKRKKCMIGTGSMCDPYMPIESELRYTRQSLALADRYGFGFTLITKSDRVLEDLDLLKSIHASTKCVVQMTLTTYDEDVCRVLEPNVSTTKDRFHALKELQKAGIPAIVWLCPILPWINDTKENLYGILDYCIEAGVKGILCFNMGVTMRDGDREYFYEKLDQYFPGLKERYIQTYGNQYNLTSPNNEALMRIFHEITEAHQMMHDNQEIFHYLNTFEQKHKSEQLCLFDEPIGKNNKKIY